MSKRPFIRQSLAAIFALAVALPTGVLAQQADKGKPADASGGAAIGQAEGNKLVELRLELKELQREITEIRDGALQANPELQKSQKALQESVLANVAEQGLNPEEDIERLQTIAEKIRAPEVTDKEQQKLAREYQQLRMQLMQARRTALQDPEIQKQREAFSKDLRAAMESQNPNVEDLIAQFNETQQELRKRMQAAGMGGGRQGAGQAQDAQSGN